MDSQVYAYIWRLQPEGINKLIRARVYHPELLKGELRVDREAEAEDDRRSSGGDRTSGDTPEFDELGTDCDRKKLK